MIHTSAVFIAKITDSFNVPKGNLNNGSVSTIFSLVFGLMAAIALVMLLLASLKYITSRGEPGEVAKAKNSIIYSLIGLAVVAGAFTIVTFVASKI